MKVSKQPFLSFLKEIAIIVIGVLIAVTINNLKESISNKKYTKKALSSIEKEIQHNKLEVEEILELHIALIDSIQSSVHNDQETISEMILRFGGLQTAGVKSIGLRFFISNKAELIDYEIISQLAEIETSTSLLEKKMDRMIDFIYDQAGSSDKPSKTKFLIFLGNVIDSEQAMLAFYKQFLDKNKAYLEEYLS